MKLFVTLILTVFTALIGDAQSLIIEYTPNEVFTIEIGNIQKLSYSPDSLFVHQTDGTTTALPLLNMSMEYDLNTSTSNETTSILDYTLLAPNPVLDKLLLTLPSLKDPLFVRITNVSGQLLLDGDYTAVQTEVSLPVGQLATGIYFCTLQSGEANTTKIFIKK